MSKFFGLIISAPDAIEARSMVASGSDYKSVLNKEVHEMLFENFPPVNEILKENTIYFLQTINTEINSNNNLMDLFTGTKLKKVRCLIAKNESKEQVDDFDKTLKVKFSRISN